MQNTATATPDLRPRIRRFNALLNKANAQHQKEAMLSGYGAASTNDLSAEQLDALCQKLQDMVDAPLRKARSTVLSLLDDLGIQVKKDNWAAVNLYLQQPRIAGKMLYQMSVEELQACAVRLRVVIKKRTDRVDEEMRLARYN